MKAGAGVVASTGLAILLQVTAAGAASIGSGPLGIAPHIAGLIRPGDADEVATDFSGPLKYPLSIKIDPLSHPLELMKIGLWLQQRRPAVQLRESCVGSCARSILLSTGPLTIKPGTVIAFGGMTDMAARIKDQIEAGELFTADDRSQASRERLLEQFKTNIGQSLELRELLARQVQPPADARAFIDAVTGGWRVSSIVFTAEQASFSLEAGRHHCMWWVPDAQGLRQLGLDVPGYRPVSASEAARLLKVPERFVHVGPAQQPPPQEVLCAAEGAAKFNFPPLP